MALSSGARCGRGKRRAYPRPRQQRNGWPLERGDGVSFCQLTSRIPHARSSVAVAMREAGAAARSAAARVAAWLGALAARAAPLCAIAPCADRDSWYGAPGPDSQEDALTEELFTKARPAREPRRCDAAGFAACAWLAARILTPPRAQLLEHSPDMFLFGNGNTCEYESKSLTRALGHSLIGCVEGFAAGSCELLTRLRRSPVMLANVHPDDHEAMGEGVARARAAAAVHAARSPLTPALQWSRDARRRAWPPASRYPPAAPSTSCLATHARCFGLR
jgi:hypothetical protein